MSLEEWVNDLCKANNPRIPQDINERTRQRYLAQFPSWDGGSTRPWESHETEAVHHAVAGFIIFGGSRPFKHTLSSIKQCSTNLYNSLVEEVRTELSYSFIFQRLWKALYFRLKKKCYWKTAAREFNVPEVDLRYVWQHLDDDQRIRVLQESQHDTLLDPIPAKDLEDIIKQLERHARYLAKRKLTFIAKYDQGHDQEDQISMLLVKGMATVRNYEYLAIQEEVDGETVTKHDILKITNYARRSMSNHSINWIKYNTHKDRARIVNVGDGVERECTQCESKLPPRVFRCPECGAEGKAPNNMNSYQATTLSLDAPTGEDGAALHNAIAGTLPSVTSRIEDHQFWKQLDRSLEEREVTFVKILLGDGPTEFDAWLMSRYWIKACRVTLESLKWYAARWLSLDRAATEERLREVFLTSAVRKGYTIPPADQELLAGVPSAMVGQGHA